MKYHPDKSILSFLIRQFFWAYRLDPSPEAEQKFKEVNMANEILSDPSKVRLMRSSYFLMLLLETSCIALVASFPKFSWFLWSLFSLITVFPLVVIFFSLIAWTVWSLWLGCLQGGRRRCWHERYLCAFLWWWLRWSCETTVCDDDSLSRESVWTGCDWREEECREEWIIYFD